jgi:hypothetical protein
VIDWKAAFSGPFTPHREIGAGFLSGLQLKILLLLRL